MKTIVLGIESIPDAAAASRAGVDLKEGFPAWPLHQIACVSLLTVTRQRSDQQTFDVETFSRAGLSERGIVASVERRIEDAFEVITFNGRSFDLPVLLTRAALTGERCPTIAKLMAQSRFRSGTPLDLLEEATAFGAAPRVKLSYLCAAFPIPVKIDVHGGEVGQLADDGNWDAISRYCETDVVATWLALQLWRSAQRADPEAVVPATRNLAEWIRGDQPRLAHLLPYASNCDPHGDGDMLGDPDLFDVVF